MKIGDRVKVIKDTIFCPAETTGRIIDKRGGNFERGKRVATFFVVWLDTGSGGFTISSNLLKKV